MSVPRFILSATKITLLALCCLLLLGAGCQQGREVQLRGESVGDLGDEAIVLVRVEEVEITLEDLFQSPNVYMLLDEMVRSEVIRQEAARRGVVVTQEEIQESVDQMMEQYGGLEALLENVPPAIPKSLIPNDLQRTIAGQLYQEAILEDVYEEEQGPATEEEILEVWEDGKEWLQRNIATDQGIEDPEEVTMDMARESIEEQLKQSWISDRGQTFFEELTEQYEIENYLLEQFTEEEDVEVPLLPEEVLEGEAEDQAEDNSEELTEPEPEESVDEEPE